jgi:hypothetical protein
MVSLGATASLVADKLAPSTSAPKSLVIPRSEAPRNLQFLYKEVEVQIPRSPRNDKNNRFRS